MNDKPHEQKELVEEIQRGNSEVFEVLFRAYYSSLCDFAWQYIRSKSEAEEIVQAVFINIWNSRNDWQPKSSIKSYLFRSVKNRSINYLKQPRIRLKSRVDVNDVANIGIKNAEELLNQEELRSAIQTAVNLLPEKCRQVFNYVKVHGLSYKETAEALGISVKTVEVQMGRALKKLRSSLKNLRN